MQSSQACQLFVRVQGLSKSFKVVLINEAIYIFLIKFEKIEMLHILKVRKEELMLSC